MRRILFLLGAVAVGALAGWFFFLRPPLVPVCRVEARDLNRRLVVMGRVVPDAVVTVASTIPGRVREVAAKENDTVPAGALLVALDDRELKANLKVAEAAVAQARAKFEQIAGTEARVVTEALSDARNRLADAQKNYERDKQLFEKQALSAGELQRSELALKTAQTQYAVAETRAQSIAKGGNDFNLARAALDQALANRDLAAQRLTEARLTAPFEATVLSRTVDPGAVVQPGQALLTIASAQKCHLVADIEERNLGLVYEGQPALVSAEAFPDRRFAASVTQIARAVDPQRGTVRIKLAPQEKPDYLRADMTVSIDLDVARIASALLVPAGAVRGEGAERFVWVCAEGRVVKRPVLTEGVEGAKVRVVEGLAPGEWVVLPDEKRPPQDEMKARAAEQGGC